MAVVWGFHFFTGASTKVLTELGVENRTRCSEPRRERIKHDAAPTRYHHSAICKECKATAYHYKGHCYIQCPPGTYPSAPIASEVNGASHQADIDEIATNGQRPLPPSSLRRRREQHVVDALMNSLSPNTSNRPNSTSGNLPRCLQCHTTCLKCTGPKATDCTECQAAFRSQPIASGGESHICVSINDKRGQQLGASSNGSSGQPKTSEAGLSPTTQPTVTGSEPAQHNYLPSVLFLGAVLGVAFVAIYVLWLHCFQGTPGIGDLTGAASALVGDSGGDGGGGAGLASIRYDRVHTNEQPDEDEPFEDDDESASSDDDDEGDLLSVSVVAQTIASIER